MRTGNGKYREREDLYSGVISDNQLTLNQQKMSQPVVDCCCSFRREVSYLTNTELEKEEERETFRFARNNDWTGRESDGNSDVQENKNNRDLVYKLP